MGYHRATFYEVKRAFQVSGVAGRAAHDSPHPNRLAEDVEKKILDYSLRWATHGPQRVAKQLRLEGTNVREGGVSFSDQTGSDPPLDGALASAVSGCATPSRRGTSASCGSSTNRGRTRSSSHRSTKWYATPEGLQTDLDVFLVFYNFARSHQGSGLAGRTASRGALRQHQRTRPPAPAARARRGAHRQQTIVRPEKSVSGKTRLVHTCRPPPTRSSSPAARSVPRDRCRGNTRLAHTASVSLSQIMLCPLRPSPADSQGPHSAVFLQT